MDSILPLGKGVAKLTTIANTRLEQFTSQTDRVEKARKGGSKEKEDFQRDEFGDLFSSFDGGRSGMQSRQLTLDLPCEREFVLPPAGVGLFFKVPLPASTSVRVSIEVAPVARNIELFVSTDPLNTTPRTGSFNVKGKIENGVTRLVHTHSVDLEDFEPDATPALFLGCEGPVGEQFTLRVSSKRIVDARADLDTRKLAGWEEKIEELRANPAKKEEFLQRLAAERRERRKQKGGGRCIRSNIMSLSAMSVSGVEEYEARAGRAMDRANHHSEVRQRAAESTRAKEVRTRNFTRRAETRRREAEAEREEDERRQNDLDRLREWLKFLAAAAWGQNNSFQFERNRHVAQGMKNMTNAATKIQLFIIRRLHRLRKIKYLTAGLGFRTALGLVARGVLLARRHAAASLLRSVLSREVEVDIRLVLARYLNAVRKIQKQYRLFFRMVRARIILLMPFAQADEERVAAIYSARRVADIENPNAHDPQYRGKLLLWGTKGVYTYQPLGGGKRSSTLAVREKAKAERVSPKAKSRPSDAGRPASQDEGGPRLSVRKVAVHPAHMDFSDTILPTCILASSIKRYVIKNMRELYDERKRWNLEVKRNREEIEATRQAGKVHRLDAARPREFSLSTAGLAAMNDELVLSYLQGEMKHRVTMMSARRRLQHGFLAIARLAFGDDYNQQGGYIEGRARRGSTLSAGSRELPPLGRRTSRAATEAGKKA